MQSYYLSAVYAALVLALTACQAHTTQGAPQPPRYPNARDVTEERQYGGNVRITKFQTTDQPATVLAFYKNALVEEGWEINKMYRNAMTLVHVGRGMGAAYDVAIMVASEEHGGQAEIHVRQAISGPFDWVEP